MKSMSLSRIAPLAVATALALLASGCMSSARFGPPPDQRRSEPIGVSSGGPVVVYGDPGLADPTLPSGPYSAPPSATGPVGSGPIMAEPLPPPGSPPSDYGSTAPGVVSGGGIIDESPATAGSQTVIASRPTETPGLRPAAPAGRMAAVGNWRLRDATGSTCRVNLSSAPALDLYKASASGCTNRDLGRITAWDNRDGEIYLYQPGGTVAARLRPGGSGYEGALTKSGATIAMER